MTDEEVIADLVQVRGIGRWTAEMFLMFNLLRPDVFPLGDLGLQKGLRVA
jgi:DNA-3-methyladenine glycosylase II